jgi:hypothetical protein
MTPQEFVEYEKRMLNEIDRINLDIEKAFASVDNTLPTNLRMATPEDIKTEQIIWYKEGDDGPFWKIVKRVLNPSDLFKAYCAEDGSRYGLDDAWIAIE